MIFCLTNRETNNLASILPSSHFSGQLSPSLCCLSEKTCHLNVSSFSITILEVTPTFWLIAWWQSCIREVFATQPQSCHPRQRDPINEHFLRVLFFYKRLCRRHQSKLSSTMKTRIVKTSLPKAVYISNSLICFLHTGDAKMQTIASKNVRIFAINAGYVELSSKVRHFFLWKQCFPWLGLF